MSHLEHVLLINHHAIGLAQKFFQNGMLIIHCFRMMKPINIFAHHSRVSHTRADDGTRCHQGLVVGAAQLAQQATHSWTLNIEASTSLGLEQLTANEFVLF